MPDSTHRYDPRGGPRDRGLRVSDRERDAVAEILRAEHLAGRLDSDEFQDRLERCLSGKRYADLDELVADFPVDDGSPAPRRLPLRAPLALLALAFVIAAIVASHALWVAIPAFFIVVRPLLWRDRAGGGHRGRWACASGPARPGWEA